jgi:hypothetical protein
MLYQSRLSVLFLGLATAAFVTARKADLKAYCCENLPMQCMDNGYACYDNGYCLDCSNQCDTSHLNCEWIACSRC